MNKSRQPKLLDIVAVLNPPADAELEVGDVGTVVELLPPDGLEVEFLQRDGRTRCFRKSKWCLTGNSARSMIVPSYSST